MRFFKKFEPRLSKIWLSTGSPVVFQEVDNEWGVLATENGFVIGELEACIRDQRGGVLEINQAEYDELKKKAVKELLPRWREVINPRRLSRMLAAAKNGVAAGVKRPLPSAVRRFSEAKHIAPPAGVSDYRPKPVDRHRFEEMLAKA